MAKTVQARKPVFELGLLTAALASAVVAMPFNARTWFLVSVLMCIFSGLAAVVTLQLSKFRSGFQLGALIIGIVGAGLGIYWWMMHRDEPEIFSPIFLGYLGAGLGLSAVLTLVGRQRSNS
jgi:hypothetical protein